MSERDTQIQRDVSVDVDTSLDDDTSLEDGTSLGDDTRLGDETGLDGESTPDDSSGGRIRTLLGKTVGSVVSVPSLAIAVVLTVVSMIAFGAIPLLGIVGNLLGIFVAGFLYGTASKTPRYLELALAGALAGGGSAFLGNVVLTLFGAGLPIVAIGLVGGALAGAAGHYFGQDLRDGLTRDIS